MDVIEAVEFFLRRLLEGVVMGRSGVVDEEIETLSAKTGWRTTLLQTPVKFVVRLAAGQGGRSDQN